MIKEVKTFKKLISLLDLVKRNKEFSYIADDFEFYCDWIIKEFYNKNSKLISYQEEDKTIGYLVSNLFNEVGRKVYFLKDLFVLPEYRGKGIGGLLVADFICTSVEIEADISRFTTRTLSEKFIKKLSKDLPYSKYTQYDFYPKDKKTIEMVRETFGG